MRNKEAFEYMLKRGGGDQKLFEYLKRACMKEREDRLEWLLEAFSEKVKKLVHFTFFFFRREEDCFVEANHLLLYFSLSKSSSTTQRVIAQVDYSNTCFLMILPNSNRLVIIS